jgi:hypothetical protein
VEALEESGFPRKQVEVRSVAADRPTRDYQGLLMAVACKQAAPATRGRP